MAIQVAKFYQQTTIEVNALFACFSSASKTKVSSSISGESIKPFQFVVILVTQAVELYSIGLLSNLPNFAIETNNNVTKLI